MQLTVKEDDKNIFWLIKSLKKGSTDGIYSLGGHAADKPQS